MIVFIPVIVISSDVRAAFSYLRRRHLRPFIKTTQVRIPSQERSLRGSLSKLTFHLLLLALFHGYQRDRNSARANQFRERIIISWFLVICSLALINVTLVFYLENIYYLPSWGGGTISLHHPFTPSLHHPFTPSLHHPFTPSLHHPFTPSLLRSFAPSLLRSFAPSLLRSFAPSLLRSFAPSLLRSFAPSLLRSFAPSLLRSFASSLLRSFAPSLLRSFAPSLLRSFAPSLYY